MVTTAQVGDFVLVKETNQVLPISAIDHKKEIYTLVLLSPSDILLNNAVGEDFKYNQGSVHLGFGHCMILEGWAKNIKNGFDNYDSFTFEIG